MKQHSRLVSTLVCCILLPWGTAQAQKAQTSPFDGMSAIDIAVAAAMRKQGQEPNPSVSQLATPAAATPPISFFQCEIVELRGRFMHEGWFPIPGNPLPGTATAQATLLGPWQTAEFRLVSLNEDFLHALELALDDEASDGKTFLGSFDVPGEAFKMAVSGVDDQNAAFDVICPKVFQPQSLEVRFDKLFNLANPGLIPLELSITNHGESGIFDLLVEDDMGVGATIDDPQVAIDQDGTITTTVHLNVPAISVGVLDIIVTATAIREGDPGQGNLGTAKVRIQKFNLIHEDSFEAEQSNAGGSQ